MHFRIVAIDVGFRSTGLAAFNVYPNRLELAEFDCVHTEPPPGKRKKALKDVDRIQRNIDGIVAFLEKNDAMWMVVELPTGGSKSSRAARAMGMATTMIVSIAKLLEIQAEWYEPIDIKRAACDKNSADKEEVMVAMAEIFPEILVLPKGQMEHVADACACMIAAQNGEVVKHAKKVYGWFIGEKDVQEETCVLHKHGVQQERHLPKV